MEPKAHILLPPSTPAATYYDCRFAVLREPLGFQRGAELLSDDEHAIHAWVEDGARVVSVGRAHLIAPSSDGSAADHAASIYAAVYAASPDADGYADAAELSEPNSSTASAG